MIISAFRKDLFSLLGTTLSLSTSYHPQTDEQTEFINRCLESYLRCMTDYKPKAWKKWLDLAQYWYNTSYHQSLKCSPFETLFGFPPPLLTTSSYLSSAHKDAADLVQSRTDHIAQNRMKQYTDRSRTEQEFCVGDFVYLKLQPYRQSSLAIRHQMKLAMRISSSLSDSKGIGEWTVHY
ncbi:hypothetical protein LIER_42532 [Lithospermum erythrorhizon]|uniref:Integrase catalytic domain-containing protein n=1 Tax=Lithospermum erythrorhizon TaxID=34254 RepID=A0AAV3NHH7_LITER